jgi:transposase InsO family protein
MMSRQDTLTIERMCEVAQVSRASFYRFLEPRQTVEEGLEMRSKIQRVALQNKRRLGYRRLKKELQNQGLLVGRDKLLQIMREDNLLSVRKCKFRVTTTDSRHRLQVYLNLARNLVLTGTNQLWVADITYIRLRQEFVFLAVVLDAFSRKVVGWALDRGMTTELTLRALQQALAQRQPPPGLVHHSDRGVQYASADYMAVLQQHHILPSMSRAGNPYDNATCESFIATLKVEEIYAHDYRDLEHLRAHLEDFLERYYNRLRLHSALNYRSPEEFEREWLAASASSPLAGAAILSFWGHGEIFQCNGEQPRGHSPTHCLDESPAGYSWAGCSPAEPACASPAEEIIYRKGSFE